MGLLLVAGMLLGMAQPCLALAVSEIPNPRLEGHWVSDTAHQISAPTERRLNGLLDFLERETGVEMAIVTLLDTPSQTSPKAFATQLFNTWGIGKVEENNGILLWVGVNDRRVELEIGRGMEVRLTPDRLLDILQHLIRPALQQGEMDRGIWDGTTALVADLTGIDPNVPLASDRVRSHYLGLLIGGLVLLLSSFSWIIVLAQQPGYLPPTGAAPYPTYAVYNDLKTVSFDRVVSYTPYSPKWNFMALIGIALGLVLSAMAIAFWVLVEFYVPYDTRSTNLALLIFGVGSLFGFVLIQPLNSLLRSEPFLWKDSLLTGLMLVLGGGLTVLGVVGLGFGLFSLLWSWFTPLTEPLRISLMIPLYVGLWNLGTAIYFVQDHRDRRRRPPTYLCQACRHPIQNLDVFSPELLALLPLKTTQTNRGWWCPNCYPTLSLEHMFLITQEIPPKTYRSSGSSYSSLASSSSSCSSSDSSSAWESSVWDNNRGSSDFGGGSSDGGGVGDSW